MNELTLVGKIKELIKINEDCQIKLAVQRYFKNELGEYETDLIPVKLYGEISKNILKLCTEDSVIGIKGRLQSNGENIEIIAEKVTFLSNKKENKNE